MNQLRVDYTQAVNSRYSHSVHIVSPSTQVCSPNNGVLYKLLSQVWSFQTPVTVHFSFLVLLVLSFLGGLKDKNALWSIFLILYFGPFLFITILIHEFGHIVMTKALGGEVLGLVLWPLGGGGGVCSMWHHGQRTMWQLEGGVGWSVDSIPSRSNLVWILCTSCWRKTLFLIFCFSSTSWKRTSLFAVFFCHAVITNAHIFVFNMLPAYPLDGGWCLCSKLLIWKVDKNRAALITAK